MKKLILSMSMFLLCGVMGLHAESRSEYGELVSLFNEKVLHKDYDEAFNVLLDTNPALKGGSAPEIEEVKKTLLAQVESLGGIQKITNLGVAKYGDYLVQVTSLVVFRSGVMRFEFQFFKNDAGWMFLNFNCDSGLESDLRGRARLLIERKLSDEQPQSSGTSPASR